MSEEHAATKPICPSHSPRLLFQLECLKLEIEVIDRTIARLDNLANHAKQWSVVVWAGGVSLALSWAGLHRYLLVTCVLPLAFWVVDATWRHLMRRSSYRQSKIMEFLNDARLAESYRAGEIVGFTVLDPVGRTYRMDEGYRRATSFWRVLWYGSVFPLHGGLVVASLVLAWVLGSR